MRLKNIILLTGMLLPASSLFAQYAEDALRFSQTEQGATARFRGLGNAQTALGGDISSLASNPAGLGLFTKSEFTFTPQFLSTTSDVNFLNTNSNAKSGTAGVSQLGIAIYNPVKKRGGANPSSGWLSTNIAISYNKTNNFDNTLDYRGSNNSSSFTDYIADIANGRLDQGDPSANANALAEGSLERMAYDSFLIEYAPEFEDDPESYFSTTAVNPANQQRELNYRTGSQSEVNFGLSTNYSNQLYLGASISLASINFNSDRTFTESGKTRSYAGQPSNFVNAGYGLTFRSNQETTGSGINAKLGFIYRAAPFIRLGASFISPTWYTVSDSYSEELEAKYTPANGSYLAPYTNDQQLYPTEYRLRTPYRLNGGLAFVINKLGLITGDVEYVDYASMKFESSDAGMDNDMKRDIRARYESVINIRFGAEAKIHPQVQLRAGYNVKGNPYKNIDYKSNILSAGAGYRIRQLSFDLTYSNQSISSVSRPYNISDDYPDHKFTGSGPEAASKNSMHNVFATIGFRF